MADEMLLNTFAAIAQEESKSISQNQRLSIVKRMEAGEYIASNAPYGYRLIDKKLVIYEPEAEVVRWIFAAYLNGISTVEIAHELSAKSVLTKGKKEQWKANRIAYILSNEKYDGDTLFQKYYGEETVPFKKHRNYGEMDQFFAYNTHDAILPQGMFQAAQTLLQSRGRKFGRKMSQSEYPLTSRIRCSECGAFYHRKVRNGTVKWVCSRHAADTTACNSDYYSEERIYDGIITMTTISATIRCPSRQRVCSRRCCRCRTIGITRCRGLHRSTKRASTPSAKLCASWNVPVTSSAAANAMSAAACAEPSTRSTSSRTRSQRRKNLRRLCLHWIIQHWKSLCWICLRWKIQRN